MVPVVVHRISIDDGPNQSSHKFVLIYEPDFRSVGFFGFFGQNFDIRGEREIKCCLLENQ